MATASETVETYDVLVMREDLQEAYSMISPEETPFQQAGGTRTVTQPKFDWPTLELAPPDSSNKVQEGDDDPGADDGTLPLRWWNYTQISDKTVSVSHTAQASDAAANDVQRLMSQVSLKLRELKRDMEVILLSNFAADAGVGETQGTGKARQTAGMQAWLSTNVVDGGGTDPTYSETTYGTVATAAAAGTPAAIDETAFNDLIEKCWTRGGEPDMVLVNGGNKRVISATFVGNATRYQPAPDKEVVAAIDFYDSDFGMLTVVPTRFLPALDATPGTDLTGTSYSVLLLDPDYYRVAFLDNVQRKPLAETGHTMKSLIWGEYGLQVDNEAAHGIYRDTTNAP